MSATRTTHHRGFTSLGEAVCTNCAEDWEPGDPKKEERSLWVFLCPDCGNTFCHSCTDLEAWESDAVKVCPHCGWMDGAAGTEEPEAKPRTGLATMAALAGGAATATFGIILCGSVLAGILTGGLAGDLETLAMIAGAGMTASALGTLIPASIALIRIVLERRGKG